MTLVTIEPTTPVAKTTPLYFFATTAPDMGDKLDWMSKVMPTTEGDLSIGPPLTLDDSGGIATFWYSSLDPNQGAWIETNYSLLSLNIKTSLNEFKTELDVVIADVDKLKEVTRGILAMMKDQSNIEDDFIAGGMGIFETALELIPYVGPLLSSLTETIGESLLEGGHSYMQRKGLMKLDGVLTMFASHFVKYIDTALDDIDYDSVGAYVKDYLKQLHSNLVTLMDSTGSDKLIQCAKFCYKRKLPGFYEKFGTLFDYAASHAWVIVHCFDTNGVSRDLKVEAGDIAAAALSLVNISHKSRIYVTESPLDEGFVSFKASNHRTYEQILKYIESARKHFKYNFVLRNCQTFAHDFMNYLVTGKLPNYVLKEDL